MTTFPFDRLKDVFIKELKSVFTQFIDKYKDKKPYIFSILVPDYIAINHQKSYCISFNGNTVDDFEANGYCYTTTDSDELYYKYCADEWNDHSISENDFPECNKIILEYIIENETVISDDDFNYCAEFIQFREDFFETLIQLIEQLKAEGFFKSVYQEHLLINFEVRDYYQEDEMLKIFERLNTKEDAGLYAKWL
ncbi:hypothetical protein J2Z32_004232 [Paenibacillus turicensis]|uniref:DUF4303 domain-containing protein n=1 Tax=Paenibacillus turicensis TaxID=160487 RepID=A0ABS4FYD2_9BACL|nr:DUF4303 domain-containing protein [Paenibacillus turicensis]MBP1907557.1 hypothetical protein [Paenibacillus turicensis]